MKIEKDIFKTSLDITTFLYLAKDKNIINKNVYDKLTKFCREYIRDKELTRKVYNKIIHDERDKN